MNRKTETMVPKVDPKSDLATSDLQQTFIRKAQKLSEQNLSKAHMNKLRNRVTGIFLAVMVGTIYAYTIRTVKQETFLDELPDSLPEKQPQ